LSVDVDLVDAVGFRCVSEGVAQRGHRRRRRGAKQGSDRLKCFTKEVGACPFGGVCGVGVIGSHADAPYFVVRAGFCKEAVACVEKVLTHGWILREFFKSAHKHYVFSHLVPFMLGEVFHKSAVALVHVGFGRKHDVLKHVFVVEVSCLGGCKELFGTGVFHSLYRKCRRGPLRKNGRRLPEKNDVVFDVGSCGVEGSVVRLSGIPRGQRRVPMSLWRS